VRIRDARPSDLERTVAIYNASIPGRMATADLDPVGVEDRRSWFEHRDPERRPLWIAEYDDGDVAGFLSVNDFYEGRRAYGATAELGVYVDPGHQRAGVGGALLDHAIDAAPALGLTTLLAFVFGHNVPSVALFERRGFTRWGLLPEVAELDGRAADLTVLGRRL
jgi:L-amino acid N-acyltransferase YncA